MIRRDVTFGSGSAAVASRGWEVAIAAAVIVSAIGIAFQQQNVIFVLLLGLVVLPLALSLTSDGTLVVGALIVGSFLNFAVGINIAGVNIRPTAFLVIPVLVRFVMSGFRVSMPIARLAPLVSLLLFVMIYGYSTLVNVDSDYFVRGIIDTFLLFINVAHFGIVAYYLHRDRTGIDRAMVILLVTGLIYSALVLVGFGLAVTGISYSLSSFTLAASERTPELQGSLIGFGTTVGSYVAGLATCSIAGLIVGIPHKQRLLLVSFVFETLAVLLSYSRGPWLAFLIGMILCAFVVMIQKSWVRLGRHSLQAIMTIGIVLLAGTFLLSVQSDVRDQFSLRASQLLAYDSGTGLDRTSLWGRMVEDLGSSPVIGLGGSNYRKFTSFEGQVAENLFVEVFHGSGVLGLLFLTLPIAWLSARTLLYAGRSPNEVGERWIIPVGVGMVTMLVAALTNPAGWGSLFWVVLAIWLATLYMPHEELGNNAHAPHHHRA